MTPPNATQADPTGSASAALSAIQPLVTLRRRSDFLAANHGLRQTTPGFLLQARERKPDEGDPDIIRIGFTCSKKVGNAVTRNRAKRRLREIARLVLPHQGRAGWDYVLIGRVQTTVSQSFDQLVSDLGKTLSRIHQR